MFIQNLNPKQQGVLLFLAHEMAIADGSDNELQLGMMQIIEKQCATGVKAERISLDNLSEIFNDKRSKCSLLLELLGIAHANQEYHKKEQKLIREYADRLGVDQDQLIELEIWVDKQLYLSREVEKLLNS